MKHSKLPHIDLRDHYQFVTFRTKDSVTDYLQKIYGLEIENSKKQMLIDEYLDRSENGAYLYGDKINIVKETVMVKNSDWYEVEAMAVMPNHVHLLFRQKESLGKIMKYIKAKSAIELNKVLDSDGQFWAKDYYDRAIRNEAHFDTVYRYIQLNPIKSGLSDARKRVYLKYK